VQALTDAAKAAREAGPTEVPAELVEALASLDLETLDDEGFAGLLGSVGVGLGDGGQPETAVVNAILNALPPSTREELLVRFLSALYSGHV
jgi:hypothetical protein